MRSFLFIINPVAGHGRGKNLIQIINEFMQKHDFVYQIKISNQLGNVTELAKWGSEQNFTDIVVVGGDGSLVEAINGIDFEKDIRLGIVPAGTGNDFAKALNLPKDYQEALEVILQAKTKDVDLGMVNGMKFINVCCCGIDGEIIMDTDKIKKYVRGSSAYLVSTLKNLSSYKAKRVHIEIDGVQLQREIILVAVGNGQYVGGGMKVTPGALIDDGEFEICVVNKLNKLKLIALFPSIFKGEHTQIKPTVEMFRGKSVHIRAVQDRLMVNADGNIIGTTPVKIEITGKKTKVIGVY